MKSTDLRYHPQATTIIAECELLRWRIAKGLYSCRSCIEDVLLLFVFARAEHHPALLLNVSACKFCWVELHSDQYLCQFCIILHPLHAEYGAGSNWQPLVACVIVGSTFSPNPPLLAIQTNCSSTSIAVHKCPAWINALILFPDLKVVLRACSWALTLPSKASHRSEIAPPEPVPAHRRHHQLQHLWVNLNERYVVKEIYMMKNRLSCTGKTRHQTSWG